MTSDEEDEEQDQWELYDINKQEIEEIVDLHAPRCGRNRPHSLQEMKVASQRLGYILNGIRPPIESGYEPEPLLDTFLLGAWSFGNHSKKLENMRTFFWRWLALLTHHRDPYFQIGHRPYIINFGMEDTHTHSLILKSDNRTHARGEYYCIHPSDHSQWHIFPKGHPELENGIVNGTGDPLSDDDDNMLTPRSLE